MFSKITLKKVGMGVAILILANMVQPYVVAAFNKILNRGV